MAYPDSIQIQVKINSSWVDITTDVILSQSIERGIRGNGYLDRVASTGSFKFILNNKEKKYIPSLGTAMSGWGIGIPVRLIVNYDGEAYVKFYGHIKRIDPVQELTSNRVEVTALDWFDYSATTEIDSLNVQENKTIVTAVQEILTKIPVQPQRTTYNSCMDTFPTVFDDADGSVKALSEFSKLANSEFGYVYLRGDKDTGENLVVEGRNTRNYTSELVPVPVALSESSRVITESFDYLITEDGDYLVMNESQTFELIDNMLSLDVQFGNDVANRVVVTGFPRKVDTTNNVLYSISSPIFVQAGETKPSVWVSYNDPDNLANKVSGKDMVNPVATTDYQMWTNQDGTGTDLTANLSVTVSYFSNRAVYTLENTGATDGYVTLLQFRGKGIYLYDAVNYVSEDTDSINAYGYRELKIKQKYQTSAYNSSALADVILSQAKEARATLYSVTFLANYSGNLFQAFLSNDIGDLVKIKSTKTGIDSYYYIQGVDFTINQGGIIYFTWIVKEALSLNQVYWLLDTSTLGETTVVGF